MQTGGIGETDRKAVCTRSSVLIMSHALMHKKGQQQQQTAAAPKIAATGGLRCTHCTAVASVIAAINDLAACRAHAHSL
jgi:hypothetical protein